MHELIFPDYSRNQCAIANEVLKHFGVVHADSSFGIASQNNKKLSLVLLDGLGWNLFSELKNSNSFSAAKVTSVFPSTTATALASLSSGLTPGEHGIIGYKAFFKEAGSLIKPLEFTYASSNRDGQLSQMGTLKDMFKINTVFDRLRQKKIRSTVILPNFIAGSDYSNLIYSGASEILSYKDIWEAFFLYRQELERPRSKFVHFYIPYIDSIEHVYGHGHEIAKEAASYIFNKIAGITQHNKDVTGIVTSDHGHIDIEREIDLHRDRGLLKKLELPPYGDGRAPLFKSRHDITKELSKYNLRIFDRKAFGLLFGRQNAEISDMLPDFIGAPLDAKSYAYRYEMVPQKKKHILKSNHGGLSKEEMEIPVVIL